MINWFRGRYDFLSNFHECEIVYQGFGFRNSEALFQAMKCKYPQQVEAFTNLTGVEAKRLGKKVHLRDDWESVKIKAMAIAVYQKFEQNEDLKFQLLSTRDEYIEECNCWGDTYWGTVNGRGQNNLGKILMKVREKFLKEIKELK